MKTLIALTLAFAGSLAFANPNDGCVIAGPANAPLTIQEFADFHCPYCAKGAGVMRQVLKDYPTQVKLVFRNMPLPFHGPSAQTAAKAFAAVWLQSPSLAYDFQSSLFDNQDKLTRQGDQFLFDTAGDLGINVAQMKVEMESAAVAKILADDQALAEAHGFKGTPSFLIGAQEVVGARPYADIKQVIEKELGH